MNDIDKRMTASDKIFPHPYPHHRDKLRTQTTQNKKTPGFLHWQRTYLGGQTPQAFVEAMLAKKRLIESQLRTPPPPAHAL